MADMGQFLYFPLLNLERGNKEWLLLEAIQIGIAEQQIQKNKSNLIESISLSVKVQIRKRGILKS